MNELNKRMSAIESLLNRLEEKMGPDEVRPDHQIQSNSVQFSPTKSARAGLRHEFYQIIIHYRIK